MENFNFVSEKDEKLFQEYSDRNFCIYNGSGKLFMFFFKTVYESLLNQFPPEETTLDFTNYLTILTIKTLEKIGEFHEPVGIELENALRRVIEYNIKIQEQNKDNLN